MSCVDWPEAESTFLALAKWLHIFQHSRLRSTAVMPPRPYAGQLLEHAAKCGKGGALCWHNISAGQLAASCLSNPRCPSRVPSDHCSLPRHTLLPDPSVFPYPLLTLPHPSIRSLLALTSLRPIPHRPPIPSSPVHLSLSLSLGQAERRRAAEAWKLCTHACCLFSISPIRPLLAVQLCWLCCGATNAALALDKKKLNA